MVHFTFEHQFNHQLNSSSPSKDSYSIICKTNGKKKYTSNPKQNFKKKKVKSQNQQLNHQIQINQKKKQYPVQKMSTATSLKLINLIDGSMKSTMKMNLCHFHLQIKIQSTPLLIKSDKPIKK